jgi:hypothetical protein
MAMPSPNVEKARLGIEVARGKLLDLAENQCGHDPLLEAKRKLVLVYLGISLKFQWNQRGKKSQRIATVGDEIQIHENQFPRTMLANIGHYVFNRLLIRLATPCRRHDTKIATVNTTARCFKNIVREKTMTWQKIAARKRTVCKVKSGCLVVTRLQLAIGKVTHQLRP